MKQVRVRFAPSPTGYLHMGGARTAIFNWLYARQRGGKFILRIEDTDKERSTKEAIDAILEGLKWLGIDWDEGPFFQSDYLNIHREWAYNLLKEGKAYRCFATQEELEILRKELQKEKKSFKFDPRYRDLSIEESDNLAENGKPYVIRFKVPRDREEIKFKDFVYGEIVKKIEEIEDFIILRQDGTPLYNLSCVVDDIRMEITDVIRGQDHINNTPKQILLYDAFGYKHPNFAHLPLILSADKSKLSKRKHGEVASLTYYFDKGFIPEALFNFLVLLGWSPKTNEEFLPKEKLLKLFDITKINKSNAIFNFNEKNPKEWTDRKAIWLNAQYISKYPYEKIYPFVKDVLIKNNLWKAEYENEKREWFKFTIDSIRTRLHNLNEFSTLGKAFFSNEYEIDKEALNHILQQKEIIKENILELLEVISNIKNFEMEEIERNLREFSEEKSIKLGIFVGFLRISLTGIKEGIGIFHIIKILGKEETKKRVMNFIERYLN